MNELQTDRLRLRPFRQNDLEHMVGYATREDYYRYLPLDPLTPESVGDFLNHLLKNQECPDRQHFHFAIEPAKVGHIIGAVNIRIEDEQHQIAGIGYALDSEFRGYGYMVEAVERILEFGFDELNMHRIWATCDVKNEKSWRVMEKARLRREGIMRGDKIILGERRDSYLYAIVKTDT